MMNIFCQSLSPSSYRGFTILNFIYFSRRGGPYFKLRYIYYNYLQILKVAFTPSAELIFKHSDWFAIFLTCG